jgi:hypothetical protein
MSALFGKPAAVLLTFLMVAAAPPAAHATPIQWTVSSGGNGHYYDVISVPAGISWTGAAAAAAAAGGYLATLTSAAEGTFVYNNLVNNAAYWNQEPGGSNLGPWLGGYQTSDNGSQPALNWTWVTGETWSYTNWHSGEPNNYTGILENYLSYKCWPTSGCRSDKWNDLPDNISVYGTEVIAYVIEFDNPTAIHDLGASRLKMRMSPNPFSASTSISFVSPDAAAADVRIFDVSGRLVRRISAAPIAEERRIEWDGRNDDGKMAPSGVYFCAISVEQARLVGRLVLIR